MNQLSWTIFVCRSEIWTLPVSNTWWYTDLCVSLLRSSLERLHGPGSKSRVFSLKTPKTLPYFTPAHPTGVRRLMKNASIQCIRGQRKQHSAVESAFLISTRRRKRPSRAAYKVNVIGRYGDHCAAGIPVPELNEQSHSDGGTPWKSIFVRQEQECRYWQIKIFTWHTSWTWFFAGKNTNVSVKYWRV